jgi:ankyrin repeat protein
MLLDAGADVTEQDGNGNTALHLLAFYGNHPFDATLAIARRLVAASSQPIKANSIDNTPSMILAERKQYDRAIGFWRRAQWYTKLAIIFKNAEKENLPPLQPVGGFAVIPFTFQLNNHSEENNYANKKPIFTLPRWLLS